MRYLFILIAIAMGAAVVYATYFAFVGGADVRSKAANPNCIPRGQGWSGSGLVIPDECPPQTPVRRRPNPTPTARPVWATPYPTTRVATIAPPITGYPTYPKCLNLVCLDGTAASVVDGACTCPPPLPVYEVE